MILILGRSGRGKDTCAQYLSKKYGFKVLKSYSTRPPRGTADTSHIFIGKEDVVNYKNGIAAYTKIGEYEYFATKEQIKNCDIYIIDPRGLNELKKTMPEENFFVLYLELDRNIARERAILRNPSNPLEGEIFDKREMDEDKQFLKFESGVNYDVCLRNKNFDIISRELDKIAEVYLKMR